MPSKNLKLPILDLRRDGKSYREIAKKLNCSKGTINYHCAKYGLLDTGKKRFPIPEELKKQIAVFCETHTCSQGEKIFSVSLSTIKKYRNFKKPL